MAITPYNSTESKKTQVSAMFNSIAENYDFLNHFLSAGIDKLWRRKAIRCLVKKMPARILDIATGTGDFAFEALRLNPNKVVGVDISEGMLAIGRKKVHQRCLEKKIELLYGDSENLPFKNDSFDAITVGFGVRNFENLETGLSEMLRVLAPDGIAVILEFSLPQKFPVKQGYQLYSQFFIPTIGSFFSKDKSAYTYLPKSVAAFPEGEAFQSIMRNVGYKHTCRMPLSGGIATIYLGRKD